MSDLNLKFVAKFVDQLTGPSRRALGNFYDGVSDSRKRLDRSLQTAANLSLVGAESQRMGKAIGRSLMEPISVAADFEEAMDAVKAITGANTSELNSLVSTARELGETTSFAASEAAAGMRFLGMAGFETNEIVASMPGVLDLAKAGATDLGRAADISSDILTGFGLQAQDMSRVGDVLAKTFTSSNTTLEMLGDTMKYVGPLAKANGIEIETMAAMTGLLGNAGIKGSQAGTTLRAMLTRLTAPSEAAADTLAGLGVEIENMDGNMRPLLDIIGDLETGMEDMGSVEKMSILKEVFGEEPASGIAELMSQGKDGIASYVQELQSAGGTASRIATEMGSNAKGGVKEWRSALESLSITVGSELLPALTPLIKEVTQVVRQMTAWASANPETVRTIATLTAGVAALLTAVGPIASILSGLVSTLGLVKFATATLTSLGMLPLKMAFASLVPVIKVVTGLMLANPIGLAVTAIAAGAALIMTDWGAVGDFFVKLWDNIKETFGKAIDFVISAVTQPFETLKNTLGGAWDMLFGNNGSIQSTIKTVQQSEIKTAVTAVTQPIAQVATKQPQLVSTASGDKVLNLTVNVQRAAGDMNERKLSKMIAVEVDKAVSDFFSRGE